MSDKISELKKELEKGISTLHTLRDEVRVRVHLAGMDLKEQWKKLEPQLDEVEKKAGEISEASRSFVADAVKKLEKLRSQLH
jgi:hypothetical protein